MFTQLAPLLTKGNTLLISAARSATDETKLRLTITPRVSDPDYKAAPGAGPKVLMINEPVVIEATPEELDAELPAALTRRVEHVRGVAATIAALEKQTADELKAAEQRLADAKKKGTTAGAAPVPTKPVVPAHRENQEPALF